MVLAAFRDQRSGLTTRLCRVPLVLHSVILTVLLVYVIECLEPTRYTVRETAP